MTNPDTQFGGSKGLDPKEAQKKSAKARKKNNEVRAILDGLCEEGDSLKSLLKKAFIAASTDPQMLKFLIEQTAGKATQRTEISGSLETKNPELLEKLKKDFDEEY